MIFINPLFNFLAETVGKVHHLMSFLFGYHTGMIITADIPFLSKLIEQINQADIGLKRRGIRDVDAERAQLKGSVLERKAPGA